MRANHTGEVGGDDEVAVAGHRVVEHDVPFDCAAASGGLLAHAVGHRSAGHVDIGRPPARVQVHRGAATLDRRQADAQPRRRAV